MNDHFSRAMLMALVIHVFYPNWGVIGTIGVFAFCAAYAIFQENGGKQ